MTKVAVRRTSRRRAGAKVVVLADWLAKKRPQTPRAGAFFASAYLRWPGRWSHLTIAVAQELAHTAEGLDDAQLLRVLDDIEESKRRAETQARKG